MKVSLNWVKEYLDFELPPVDVLVEHIGAQLGAVEEVIDLGAKYQGVVVAKVVECEPLPNSDHLKKCLVDDGGVVKDVERDANGLVQVLTGAPNVHKDMLAVWLAPGVTVPESYGTQELFVLTSRPMRGAMSHGMLASPRELGLSDAHEGLLDLTGEAVQPGADFAKAYGLNDYIIDIENKMFTHRPDCFGMLGVAREIAGILGHKFTSPDWYSKVAEVAAGTGLNLDVRNDIPGQVPRFMAVAIKDVAVAPSPLKMQVALARVGAKPISNVVDVTNYIMLLTGQPLHAYDYDKVGTGVLGARLAQKGEKLALLNGKTVELNEADMIITDGEKPIGLAGIIVGSDTEVSGETTNIILECATFNMYAIRRTSMRHGLFTDAVTRFNKGQSPLQNPFVAAEATRLLLENAHGAVASSVIDIDSTGGSASVNLPVQVTAQYANARLGLALSPQDMQRLLQNVECTVDINGDILSVTAPYWRTDIELREDVVEEVGRLYGFDKLPLALPKRSITPVAKNTTLELKQAIRTQLARAGANEVLTYSFVHGDLLKKVGQNPEHAFQLSNALSPDLQYYRMSLLPSLLGQVHSNIKAGYDEFALFEIGKVHLQGNMDSEGLPREDDTLALVVAAGDKLKRAGAPYYAAKRYLEALVRTPLTYQPVPQDMQSYDITKPFDMNRAAFVYAGEKFLGLIGEFGGNVTKALKLPRFTAGFELDTLALSGLLGTPAYEPLSRFPKVTQDISLKVKARLPYGDLYRFVYGEIDKARPDQSRATLTPLDIYQRAGDAEHKQITLRLQIASYEKTLRDTEVNSLLDSVAAAAKAKFGAERI